MQLFSDFTLQAIGVKALVGYGLTETSPVLSVRHMDCNVRGTIGEQHRAKEKEATRCLSWQGGRGQSRVHHIDRSVRQRC